MGLPSPVIVVPGITASELRDEYPVAPETVWSPFRMVVKDYERITPHPDDTRYELVEPARVTRDQVFEIAYRELIEELRYNLSPAADAPVPVFPFAYDWRQPLKATQEKLAEFVEEVIGRTRLLKHYHEGSPSYTKKNGKVSLVGHSMGGLIIAGYLKDRGFDRVDKVATIASPFRGSLEAVAKVTVGVGGFGLSSGASREREAARITPALYHLLPSFPGAVKAARGLDGDLFKASNWQPSIIETLSEFIRRRGLATNSRETRGATLLSELLTQAHTHRVELESFSLTQPRDWLCIVGIGKKTRVRMSIKRGEGGQPDFVLEDERNEWKPGRSSTDTGDSTVPYLGAESAFIPTDQIVCVTADDFEFFEFGDRLLGLAGLHAALPNMNLVQRFVVSHLMGTGHRSIKGKGRPAPGVTETQWKPPIAGLR